VPTAVVFPGQGSQRPAAGAAWVDHPAWSAVAEAEAATGLDLTPLLTDADADLTDTRSTQLSVLLTSLVAWRAWAETPDADDVIAVTGHSLGLVTALIASGGIGAADGARLALARADACAAAQAEQAGGMLALLGSTVEQARAACDAVDGSAWIANTNGGGQIVVGAPVEGLDELAAAATASGIRRVRRLPVDGAFHTPLMRGAVPRLRPTLEATTFSTPRWPIVTNGDARAVSRSDGWVDELAQHLITPVRWDDVVRRLDALGVDRVVEIGPGSTLTGLVRRIAPAVETINVAVPADLAVTVS